MECGDANEQFGSLIDGACPPEVRESLDEHLLDCQACRAELEALRATTGGLAGPSDVEVPAGLWPAIESRLDSPESTTSARVRRRRRPWAIAAGVVLAIGMGTAAIHWSGGRSGEAVAAPINFGALLDALPLDAERAFREFLTLYDARSIAPPEARRHAPQLSFNIPDDLPGGFRLTGVYALRFGDAPGVAARYKRGEEFLATIFHQPVQPEDHGTHRDLPCVVGEHRGHKVEVGVWALVHVTDPTTCHCILSRLGESSELPPILAAVAPGLGDSARHDHGGH